MGVIVPKRPSVSPLIPAVKNRVLAGPAVPSFAESERPQSVDGHEGIVGILQESFELVRETVECRDPAAAEIADENRVAELAEITSGPHHAPRRVEPVAMLEVADVSAPGSKDFDESEPGAGDVIVFWSVLLGIGDEDAAADVLNVEGREALPVAVRSQS